MELATASSSSKVLIRDRDTRFTAAFDVILASEGAQSLPTPVRAPHANAVAERWIGTVRRELLDRILIVGQRHLEAALSGYVAHYHQHRPHRALGQAHRWEPLPCPFHQPASGSRGWIESAG